MTNPPAEGPDSRFREQLAREMDGWQRDGLLAPEQAARILARYGPAHERRALHLDAATAVIAIAGAVVLGLGMTLFFAANWRGMAAWEKVTLVYVATAAAYAGGYLLRLRAPIMPRVGAGLLLLGSLLFQAGLFLLAQVYQMPVDSPVLFLLGAAGILPLAYATRMRSVLLLGLAAALVWFGWAYTDAAGDSPRAFALPVLYLLAGVLLYLGAAIHHPVASRPHPFHAVYQILGVITALLAVYVLTFEDLWDDAVRGAGRFSVPLWLHIVCIAVLAAIAARALVPLSRARALRRSPWMMEESGVMAAVVIVAWAALSTAHPAWSLVFNFIYFSLAILLCVRGSMLGEARFINIGVPLLALGLFTRYIDTFGDMLQGSLFFIIAGLLLLALAVVMERLRRFLLAGGVRTLAGEEGGP